MVASTTPPRRHLPAWQKCAAGLESCEALLFIIFLDFHMLKLAHYLRPPPAAEFGIDFEITDDCSIVMLGLHHYRGCQLLSNWYPWSLMGCILMTWPICGCCASIKEKNASRRPSHHQRKKKERVDLDAYDDPLRTGATLPQGFDEQFIHCRSIEDNTEMF